MRDDIADNIEQECCTSECQECGPDKTCWPGCCETEDCDIEDCALGCNDELEQARAQWEREYRQELKRLRQRVADLEEQGRAHASRKICAMMTEVDSLERNILKRPVTTSQAKKKGLEVLGVDKNA